MLRNRRDRLRSLVAVAATTALAAACGAPGSNTVTNTGSVPDMPSKPVVLNILDVSGGLQLTKAIIENFAAANPRIIKRINYVTGTAPTMAGKLQAEQKGGRVQTDLVLSGTDGLAAGIANDVLTQVLPTYDGRFPGLMSNYQPAAAAMQELSQGFGIAFAFTPSGPLLEFNPTKVTSAPSSPAELLAWAQAHKGRFQYANPANSGPGRTFLMGLPYLLHDKDPKDPVAGWDKTWAYLTTLGKYISYYPSRTGETMKNLGSGAVDMVVSTTGWDINPRVLGTVPNTVKVGIMQPHHWLTDALYALMPKGVSADVLSADLALVKWILQPSQQAIAYDRGYFYPGPAVKGVDLSMAPAQSQQTITQYGRAEYAGWIAKYPTETALPPAAQVKAFDLWNRLVGGSNLKGRG